MAAQQTTAPASDAAQLKQQRRAAYEALSGPLERLSVKQIVDFRSQDVSRAVEDAAVATMTVVVEVDNSIQVEGGVAKNWTQVGF